MIPDSVEITNSGSGGVVGCEVLAALGPSAGHSCEFIQSSKSVDMLPCEVSVAAL